MIATSFDTMAHAADEPNAAARLPILLHHLAHRAAALLAAPYAAVYQPGPAGAGLVCVAEAGVGVGQPALQLAASQAPTNCEARRDGVG